VVVRDPERRVDLNRDRIIVDTRPVRPTENVYLMLNKPRGLVTSAADERGRKTVFSCFEGKGLPFLSPVGRLDKASEGLLLFTNDTAWAARITDPSSHLAKTYHVQVDCVVDDSLLGRIRAGVKSGGDFLSARRVEVLRRGDKNSWLEVVLEEGKNRHIRRLLEGCGMATLRLVRVAIGSLPLGTLAKGAFRQLTRQEVKDLGSDLVTRHLPNDMGSVHQSQHKQSNA
jgi:23S rRNA pseudouridine2605 synthase